MNASENEPAALSHRHEDPLTHEPGAHPVATGVGAAGGGATGAAIGLAVGGPIGGMIGAVIGAVAGGLSGSAVGESIDPTSTDLPEITSETSAAPLTPSHTEVAATAWSLYEREGRPDGHDLRHWYEAEALLTAKAPDAAGISASV